MGLKVPSTLAKIVDDLECTLATLEIHRPVSRKSYSDAKQHPLQPTWANTSQCCPDHQPHTPIYWTSPCLLNLSPLPQFWHGNPELASCVVHGLLNSQSPHTMLWLDRHPVKAL